jgi:outer membrane protein assembly factor BamB
MRQPPGAIERSSSIVHASPRIRSISPVAGVAAVAVVVLMSVAAFPGVASAAIPGSQLWARRYDGSGIGDDYDTVHAAGVSPDGSKVFVTGQSVGLTSGDDYATVAYDASTGAKLWAKHYNGTGNGPDEAFALAMSPGGGRVFVTGAAFGSTSGDDYATVAYNASTGTKLWLKRYNGRASGDDLAYSVGVSPGGGKVFVTGQSVGSTSQYDYSTVAYAASTGAKLWVTRYNGPANGNDVAGVLGVSPGGSKVFVTGRSTGSASNWDYATVAYNSSNGAKLWARRYNGPGNDSDYAHGLGVSPDGSAVFVTGESIGLTSVDYGTVAYDASTGAKLWEKRLQKGIAYDVGVSPDGSTVFVTGGATGSYATLAYDASTGTKLWEMGYNGPANGTDVAYALGVSPDSTKLFVTGESEGSTSSYDYATVVYDASTGTKLWARRYNGPANGDDYARVLVVSPDGSELFVSGQSVGSTSGDDYATVAYSIT